MGELTYTNIRPEWAEALQHIEHTAFPTADTDDLYWADELRALAGEFPEGGVVVLDGGTPVAMGLGIRIHFDFSAERSADGTRPSRSDFENSCWPSLLSALSTSWRSAVCVGDDLPEVFALPIQPHHGMFPPARVVFVKEPAHLEDPRHLIVIGLDFDWSSALRLTICCGRICR